MLYTSLEHPVLYSTGRSLYSNYNAAVTAGYQSLKILEMDLEVYILTYIVSM
jgi:hypothetical protein